MSKILIFSGTSEGRDISEYLCENNIFHEVFVATEYGKIVMKEDKNCIINQGRLDESQMEALFCLDPAFVVDATHPYAIEVSKNIREACERAGIKDRYLRISREIPMTEALLREDYPNIEVVLSTEAAIDYLKASSGNILLTTGVKTLHEYASEPMLKDRLVARILPSRESLELAFEAGVAPHQIIAMEGPFLSSVNEALIEQYSIKTLVTKNSGIRGGFIEKLEAAKNKGIKTVVIDINKKADGISVEEGKRLLTGIKTNMEVKKTISIVGIGVGNDETITVAGLRAIKKANLLIGAKRMLETGLAINNLAESICEYDSQKVLEAIQASDKTNIAILVSGDISFYSGADKIRTVLLENDFDVVMLPGISSLSYFSAKIGVPYSEGLLLSAHGRALSISNELNGKKKFFSILSGPEDLNEMLVQIYAIEENANIYIGYNLGMEDERIYTLSSSEKTTFEKKGLYVMGVIFHGKDN